MSLRDLTHAKHVAAEETIFARKLIAGLSVHDYSIYLYQLSKIYPLIENYASNLGLLEGIESIKRTDAINEDLDDLINKNNNIKILPSTERYINYLETIKDDPEKIMAHMYVRHMGDLFGGQIVAKVSPGKGKFYQFENRKELIGIIRSKLSDNLAEEANRAFDFAIDMMKELGNGSDMAKIN